MDDYLSLCRDTGQRGETATREHIAGYVQNLASRPNPRGQHILHFHSGMGLSNATMQQRLTVVSLFYDYLVEKGLCLTNPVGRGTYVAGKGFGGVRDRALLAHFYKLPWIPSDDQWRTTAGNHQGPPFPAQPPSPLQHLMGFSYADVYWATLAVALLIHKP